MAQNPRLTAAVVAYAGQTDFPANFPALPVGGPYTGLFVRRVRGALTSVLDLTAFTVVAPDDGGFTARLNAGALAGDIVQVFGLLPAERDVALTPGGAVLTEILELDATLLQAQLQEHRRDQGRTLSAPLGETPAELPPKAARADAYLAFDSAGNPVAAVPSPAPTVSTLTVRRVFTAETAASLVGDQLISIEIGAAVVVAIPDPALAPGRQLIVADGLGVAAQYPITVQPVAGHIAGALQLVLSTPYACLSLISNGVTWLPLALV